MRQPKRQFCPEPLQFEPILRERLWGGRRLQTLFQRELPAAGLYGETWEVSSYPGAVSQIRGGTYAGYSLEAVWRQFAPEISGGCFSTSDPFPLLVKLLDCNQPVSVQVHPDDKTAQRLLGEPNGKSEAWVVLHTEPEANIWAGWNMNVDRQQVEQGLADGTLANLLNRIQPQVGDCISIPAGTVHTMGNGLVLLEVQQVSDATFRLFDWNRVGTDGQPRPLHIAEALQAIDWQAPPVTTQTPTPLDCSSGTALAATSRSVGKTTLNRAEHLLSTPYFEINRYLIADSLLLENPRNFQILFVEQGEIEIRPQLLHGPHTRATERTKCWNFQTGDILLLPVVPEGWEILRPSASAPQGLRMPTPASPARLLSLSPAVMFGRESAMREMNT